MIQSIFARLRQRRRLLLRELIVLACALALGLGYSRWNANAYLPGLDGNIYSMLAWICLYFPLQNTWFLGRAAVPVMTRATRR